jgi:PAS domain S-box-containing protein
VSGYTADEFVGSNPFAESIHPDDMPRCRDAFAQLLATPGLSLVVEHRARYKHGGWHWFEGTFTSLFHDPAVGGLVANVRDITERKAAQEELARLYAAEQAARAEAEAALQTRDQFLSIASHELRTPLTSLMGYASMLSRAAARSTGQVDKMTDRIVRQAQRLNGLIDQLLDVSRLQRGQFVIERQPVDLAALVVQMVDEVRAALPTNTNHVVELIRPDEPVVVAGDVQRLEQVIQNLLSNAIKYSPKGGLMRVAVLRTATNAALEVTDQGIGIPSEAQAHLFEPFYRAANVGGQMSGFGLGLHIVREIVERHGGRVEVESIEDQGSTFRVVLPLP